MIAWTQNAKHTTWNRAVYAERHPRAEMPASPLNLPLPAPIAPEQVSTAIALSETPPTAKGEAVLAHLRKVTAYYDADALHAEIEQLKKDLSVKNAALVTLADEIAALKSESAARCKAESEAAHWKRQWQIVSATNRRMTAKLPKEAQDLSVIVNV